MQITPILQKNVKEPLYVQLYSYIKREIETKNLLPGTKLPSIRDLSQYLKVSKNTVETAYQQLLAEGYVDSKPKSGIFVMELEDWSPVERKDDALFEESDPKKECKILYDFQYGDIDLPKFPLKLWKKYINEALDLEDSRVFHYGEKKGSSELRAEIAKYLYQARGVSCSPEQIILTAGTQHSISLVCQLLTLHGKKVAMEEPGYLGVRSVFEHHGCDLQPVHLEADGLSVNELSRTNAKVAYITPSHQFPYGMILSIQKRIQLLTWAYETSGYIIEDDYDGEYRYQGQPVQSLKSMDNGERVIYLGTFSKSFLPAARLSYMVLPPSLMAEYERKLLTYSQAVSPIIQKAVYLFMKNGDFDRHIRRTRKIYHDKHKALLTSIDEYMGEKVSIIGQKAGLHILIGVKGRDSAELIQLALEKGIKVYSPRMYWMNPDDCPPSLIMLGFGGLSIDQIKDGIRLLSEVWFLRCFRSLC